MRGLSHIIKNIRDLLPYLTLIAIYFFFVNLEARKEKNYSQDTEKEKTIIDVKSSNTDKDSRIIIPVIPYKK